MNDTIKTETTQPTAIFMMGGPASGKSTVRSARYANLEVIDCDLIKESLPGYDPKNPALVHDASSMEATRRVYAAIGSGLSFVFDGTGCTAEKYVRFIQAAQSAGFTTEVCWVTCDLATAIERNRNRERTVSEALLREKHAMVSTSFEIVARYADTTTTVRS